MRLVTAFLLAGALLGATLPSLPVFAGNDRTAAERQTAKHTAARKAPPILRPSATVDGDLVTLGDLFDNVGDKARTPIAYAPQPGHQVIFDAERLLNIARAIRLSWRPQDRFTRIIVSRASQTIGSAAIRAKIRAQLRKDEPNVKSDVIIDLDNQTMSVDLPTSVTPTLGLKDFSYDRRSGRFAATLLAPADAPVVMTPVGGVVRRVTEVPVLKRRVERGQVIRDDDVEYTRLPDDRIARGIVTAAGDLIGMAARRVLRAGQPVRASDVQEPIVLPKGSLATMVYRTRTMTLTARGRTLEDGSKGAVIRVMNVQSKKTVEAVVKNGNTVVVDVAAPLALRN